MKGKFKKKPTPYTLVCGGIMWLLVFFFFSMLFVAIMTSVKSDIEVLIKPFDFPEKILFAENYGKVFKYFTHPVGSVEPEYYIEHMLFFGVLYAVGCAFFSTLSCTIVAYATSRFPFKPSKVIFASVLFAMACPIVGSQASELQLVKSMNIYDTFVGAFILKFNFLTVYYMVLYAAFKGIPSTYSEAAVMDGAGTFTIMFRIIMPLVMNTIGTVFLMYFISYWNDYQTPLLYLPSYPTIAYGLYQFTWTTFMEVEGENVKLAACLIVAIPIVVLFAAFNKKLVGNLSMGGIKG
jgi:ABC-type glycerol-3-phosphate transport system permease component